MEKQNINIDLDGMIKLFNTDLYQLLFGACVSHNLSLVNAILDREDLVLDDQHIEIIIQTALPYSEITKCLVERLKLNLDSAWLKRLLWSCEINSYMTTYVYLKSYVKDNNVLLQLKQMNKKEYDKHGKNSIY